MLVPPVSIILLREHGTSLVGQWLRLCTFQPKCPSAEEWIKEDVVHIHNGILLSHKRNRFESVLVRWMNLEPVTGSEVSQKEENKCHILMHIYGI